MGGAWLSPASELTGDWEEAKNHAPPAPAELWMNPRRVRPESEVCSCWSFIGFGYSFHYFQPECGFHFQITQLYHIIFWGELDGGKVRFFILYIPEWKAK